VKHRERFLGLAIVAGLVGGCRDAKVDTSPAAPSVALPAPDPKLARIPLSDRLTMEAQARPDRAPRAEALFDAAKADGISFSRQRQVLASTIGASYCQVAVTESGLAASVCEFRDEETLARGAEASRQAFQALMPGRSFETRSNTLLTVTKPEGARAEADAATIIRVFRTLPTTALAAATAAR